MLGASKTNIRHEVMHLLVYVYTGKVAGETKSRLSNGSWQLIERTVFFCFVTYHFSFHLSLFHIYIFLHFSACGHMGFLGYI